jgi:hypothetical protein
MASMLTLSTLLLLRGVPVVGACDFLPHPPAFDIPVEPVDLELSPPSVSVEVKRSWHGPPGCGDCSEIGRLRLEVRPGSHAPEWGIRLSLAEGALPEGFRLPEHPVRVDEGRAWLAWVDHPLRPIDFALEVSVVDGLGAASRPVRVRIADQGRARSLKAGFAVLCALAALLGAIRVRSPRAMALRPALAGGALLVGLLFLAVGLTRMGWRRHGASPFDLGFLHLDTLLDPTMPGRLPHLENLATAGLGLLLVLGGLAWVIRRIRR